MELVCTLFIKNKLDYNFRTRIRSGTFANPSL